MEPVERFNDEDEAFLRRFTVPEEDRRLYTSTPRSGGYRWFRSPNIIPIERERRRRLKQASTNSDGSAA
jgi:hypothetical protein